MASQERLEYFISAAFKDEGVRQAMQAFGKLNAESAKVVNELNRISDAGARAGQKIRDSRTPYAQLGMQVNQLGTQLASGTSFATAFAQQIGDVGWALQNANGVLGTVGRFLAGPWGAAVAIAATALGPLIAKLFDTGNAANQAASAMDNLIKKSKASVVDYEELAQAETKLSDAVDRRGRIQATVDRLTSLGGKRSDSQTRTLVARQNELRSINLEVLTYEDAINKQRKYLEGKQNETSSRDSATRAIKSHSGAVSGNSAAVDQNALKIKSLVDSIQESINIYTSLDKGAGKAKNKLEEFNQKVDALSKLKGGAEIVERLKVGIEDVRRGIMDEGAKDAISAFSDELERVAVAMNIPYEDMKAKLAELGDKIPEQNDEIKKSFESIGMSVNDAFKGMLTAGMSWKDGMKGIINAVIDELWRLFVVQQIVGMVKNVLGNVFGGGGGLKMPSVSSQISASDALLTGKLPGFANGTTSAPGGLTWVGERGPELVNLPRGAGVIPAHRASQMGGGGINITVDARGSADPAAVRAQVQQGILEAAPAIVAAAQQRTVSGLRRPRLGGVMQ